MFKSLALSGRVRNAQQLTPTQKERDIQALGEALRVRFDQVQVAGNAASASASRNAFFFRGPRYHPMQPFGAADFWFVDTDGRTELCYRLSIAGQLAVGAAAWVVFTLSLGITYGLAQGALRSAALLLGLFALNTIVELVRIPRWLRSVLN